MPTIRIDDEVFEGLQDLAEPFVDTPNTVIKRLLEEKGVTKKAHTEHIAQKGITIGSSSVSPGSRRGILNRAISSANEKPRAKRGEVTPQTTYEEWLLETLWEDFKGQASKIDVTNMIISKMEYAGILKEIDYKKVSSGETRAENTIAWARNKLKEDGLIKNDSLRGIWELTEEGIKKAKELTRE